MKTFSHDSALSPSKWSEANRPIAIGIRELFAHRMHLGRLKRSGQDVTAAQAAIERLESDLDQMRTERDLLLGKENDH